MITITLGSKIDASNATEVEKKIYSQLPEVKNEPIVLDAKSLTYISSAGLRIILHIQKDYSSLKIINVQSDIYDIFAMTGFPNVMPIERLYRTVSVEGCEEIGHGSNGILYRIDQENIIKVYNSDNALADIQRENEVAKQIQFLDVPIALPYDVVKVGNSYGTMFRVPNARSLASILAADPSKLYWCVKVYVEMLNLIHESFAPEGNISDYKETVLDWANFLLPYLPDEVGKKLIAMVKAIPDEGYLIHGNYHTKNLMLQNDDMILVNVASLSVGHPIFDLANIYTALIGFYELDHEAIKAFQGYDFETAQLFWKKFLVAYMETEDEEKLRQIENKARIIGYTRLIRRAIRRNGLEAEDGKAQIAFWKQELLDLLEKTDSLAFN